MQAALPLAANRASESVVECQGVWKIFAEEQDAIRRVLEQRIGKDEALAEHGVPSDTSTANFILARFASRAVDDHVLNGADLRGGAIG